jgi:hypothetical protein
VSNGFSDYYKMRWTLVKKLTDRITQVKLEDKPYETGYLVVDGLEKNIIVFNSDSLTWRIYDAALLDDVGQIRSDPRGFNEAYDQKWYPEIMNAIMKQTISEE